MAAIAKRVRYATNPIEEDDKLAMKLERNGRKIIKLNRGDPAAYFPTPKYTIDAYISALKEGRTSYIDVRGLGELREAVAKRYKRCYNLSVDGETDVLITNGVSEAIIYLNATLVNSADKAVLFRPYYPIYMSGLGIFDGKAVMERYYEEDNWNIDVDRLNRRMKTDMRSKRHAKYMIVTNPNNPTGTVLRGSVLEDLVELANEYKLFLISDEIYDELVYNGAKFTSISKLAKGMPYMILNGASKGLDATGFRVGFMIVPEDDRLSNLVKEGIADFAQTRLSVNTPAQYAVAEAINNQKEHKVAVTKLVKQIETRANYAAKLVNESQYMRTVIPNGAYYILPKLNMDMLKIRDDTEFARKLLIEEGVQIIRGSGFGEKGHVRIVVLPPKEILESAIDRIDRFCRHHSK